MRFIVLDTLQSYWFAVRSTRLLPLENQAPARRVRIVFVATTRQVPRQDEAVRPIGPGRRR
jgi:hypothetical protein